MAKKKIEFDTSFIWALKGLKQVGSEEGVDYYHVPINDYGAFVVESDHITKTVDLILTPIVDVDAEFVDSYLTTRKDDVCTDLQRYINIIVEFIDTYKDSIVPYHGLLEMVKIALNNQ